MQFNLPTTKEEMYTVLNDLFYHYRIKRDGYEQAYMSELELERLVYEQDSEENLTKRAEILVEFDSEKEKLSKKAELESKIKQLAQRITSAQETLEKDKENIEKLYADSQEKLRAQAVKNGLINSSVYLDKTAYLESEKNSSIAKATSENENLIAQLTAQSTDYEEQLSSLDEFYLAIKEKAVMKKLDELKQDQQKTAREVFKYNNGLEEKEQRYKNTIAQANATLNLKYMEISMGEFTKDQLVDMGYYQDVIDCVCGYYDTLDPAQAYQDIYGESKLTIYLDDYYQNVVFMYGVRSGYIS